MENVEENWKNCKFVARVMFECLSEMKRIGMLSAESETQIRELIWKEMQKGDAKV